MIIDLLYNGPVLSRLALSHFLYRQFKDTLQGDDSFMNEFTLLTRHAHAVGRHMAAMNLGALCTRCSDHPSGGCCSLYMAGETDGLQMLMNLLADVDIQAVRNDGRECIFLGDGGCIFLFKPIFCLNYTCTHIHHAATSAQSRTLERLTGVLLTKQFEVEQYLLTRIRQEKNQIMR